MKLNRNCMLCNIPVRKKRFWEKQWKSEHYHLMPITPDTRMSPFCIGCAFCVTKTGVTDLLSGLREIHEEVTSEDYYSELDTPSKLLAHQRILRVYKTWSGEGLI